MREFNYTTISSQLLTPDIMNMISSIHEHKGRQEHLIKTTPVMLKKMLDVARIQSIGSSNRIEGIITTDQRLEDLVRQKTEPRNRSEQEIAGYREVLATIHESYEYIPLNPNIILQLHRNLYSFSSSSIGGHWKSGDNIIQETDISGNRTVRFAPVSAFETPAAIEKLCQEFNQTAIQGYVDPLLLIPMFILDFLCVHPFGDGNGRISRLLTLLLSYRSGYEVGKFISLEMIIEKTKDSYYDTLQASSHHWHEGRNDYRPFVQYMLGIINNAYQDFADRVQHLSNPKSTSKDRILLIFENQLGKISKRKIIELCPDIGQSTIEKALNDLLKEGAIQKVGSGKNTCYVKT